MQFNYPRCYFDKNGVMPPFPLNENIPSRREKEGVSDLDVWKIITSQEMSETYKAQEVPESYNINKVSLRLCIYIKIGRMREGGRKRAREAGQLLQAMQRALGT